MLSMLTWCGKAQAMATAALLHQLNEQVGQRQRFGAQRRHATQGLGCAKDVQPALQGRHADDGLGAAQVASDAGGKLSSAWAMC